MDDTYLNELAPVPLLRFEQKDVAEAQGVVPIAFKVLL